ncbi:hypothetical protein SteCoe_20196 [Stentor coeruleus]|uniref:Uncharacterized protein n=1 Tax=Stentor coeruleus TaxID=5963 RepID=A0A1R2BSB7_9CILI|nr:hypothetical protein SteCoe_20196 [Stentor coeruleus]
MLTKLKVPKFSLNNMEPIKIRKVRVLSRKPKNQIFGQKSLFSTDHKMISTLNHNTFSQNCLFPNTFDEGLMNFSHGLVRKVPYPSIQEIKKKPEIEDDSVILTLNELLSQNLPEKDESSYKSCYKKPQFKSLKIKLREKIIPIKSERNLNRIKL